MRVCMREYECVDMCVCVCVNVGLFCVHLCTSLRIYMPVYFISKACTNVSLCTDSSRHLCVHRSRSVSPSHAPFGIKTERWDQVSASMNKDKSHVL